MARCFLIFCLLGLVAAPAVAQSVPADAQPWSVRMAESVMARDSVVLDRWHYEVGVMMTAFEALWKQMGDERYLAYIRKNVDRFVEPDGSIETYDLADFNLDQINTGKALFPLFETTGDPRYRAAMDTLRQQLRLHPRTSEGAFWHKKVYPNQVWMDGVYMAGPFLARYGTAFGDSAALRDVAHEILLVARHLRDPQTGLYFHGWDEARRQPWADPLTGLSQSFWGRGMGWYAMALVDVLEVLPQDYPERDALVQVLQDLARAVENVQDPVTGLWYQVLDQPNRKANYLEASASTMFIYALAKGVRMGLLDPSYRRVAERGFRGALAEFVRRGEDGLLDLDGTVSVGGLGGKTQRDGSFEYYMSEPVRTNDYKGLGPFILAALEIERLR